MLYNPRVVLWSNHFGWSEDFLEILGLTSSGRATVEILRLNREKLLHLRLGLFKLGEHPPG